MKNPVIFDPSSITLFRGERKMLAFNKAGIFYSPKGVKAIVTCRGIPIMGLPVRSERVVLDSGKGQSLFCCPSNIKYHAHTPTPPHPAQGLTRLTIASALPPAAFFHTLIVNLACPVKGVRQHAIAYQ